MITTFAQLVALGNTPTVLAYTFDGGATWTTEGEPRPARDVIDRVISLASAQLTPNYPQFQWKARRDTDAPFATAPTTPAAPPATGDVTLDDVAPGAHVAFTAADGTAYRGIITSYTPMWGPDLIAFTLAGSDRVHRCSRTTPVWAA